MKKLALIVMILAVLALGVAPALAQPPAGAFALASYFPDDIDAYVGVRTDDQSIADIDGLLAKVSAFAADFGAEDVPSSLRAVFSQMDGVSPEDIDAILAWAGDGLAFGTISSPSKPDRVVLALLLDDRAAAEAFITARLTDQFEQAEDLGGFTVYEGDGYLLFSDEILLGVSEATPEELAVLTSGDFPRLSDSDGFAETVSALPDENYALGLYASEAIAGELNVGADGVASSAAAGIAVLDGSTLAVDIYSAAVTGYTAAPVDPAFARFIPANSNFYFHGSNLGGLLDAGLDSAARSQLSQIMTSAGLDLDTMLQWMSGDFAVYSRLDFASFWQPIMTGIPEGMTPQNLVNAIDIGFAVETDDAGAAAQFAQALAAQIRALPIEAPGSRTETQETLAGTEATVFTITAPDSSGITLRMALASNDEIFAVGTYNGVAASLTGEPGLAGNALATEASAYLLPDASAVWFADGEVLGGAATGALLIVVGPAIQDIFDNIAESLTGAPSATPTPSPNLMATLDFDRLMARLSGFFRYMTASVSPAENGALARVTLTLGQ